MRVGWTLGEAVNEQNSQGSLRVQLLDQFWLRGSGTLLIPLFWKSHPLLLFTCSSPPVTWSITLREGPGLRSRQYCSTCLGFRRTVTRARRGISRGPSFGNCWPTWTFWCPLWGMIPSGVYTLRSFSRSSKWVRQSLESSWIQTGESTLASWGLPCTPSTPPPPSPSLQSST